MLPRKPCKLSSATAHCDDEALTKNRVAKNASTSPLLKAPVEVRDNILRLVLGDRTIHIQYLSLAELKRYSLHDSKDADGKALVAGFYAAFCVAEKSEQEAYDEANSSSRKVQPNEDEDPDHIEPCKERHVDCLISTSQWRRISAQKLHNRLTFDKDLSALAVCRLLYEESNNVLWQTNTFAFDDPPSFRQFNKAMHASQKHKLKRIHIRISVAIDQQLFDWEDHGSWPKALVPRILTPLHNLSVLHLSFDQYCALDSASHVIPMTQFSHADSQKRMKHDMDALLDLRMLPWKNMQNPNKGKHVTVIISDDATTHLPVLGSRWTKYQKLQVAEEFRARLAAPNSGEIHEAEDAADQEAKRLKNEKSRRAMIRCIEAVILNEKLKGNVAKERAENCRAEADRRIAKQDDAIGKGLKSVETRIKSAAYHMNRADKAEARYEKISEKVAACEAGLAKCLVDPSYTPNKHVPWSTMHQYMSD